MINLWIRDGSNNRDVRQIAESSEVHPSGVARLIIPAATITNTAAPWNDIPLAAGAIDTIGGTIAGGDYTPPAGTYIVISVLNMFDNNSARVAHRERYLVGGSEYSVMQGHNYMRDATAHDSAANIYPDLISFDGTQALSLEAQTNSSTNNTTAVTGGWLMLVRVA